MLRVHGGPSEMQVQEATFFAFDDVCIPFRTNFQLHLIHGKRTPGWRTGPTVVVPKGEPGSHDEGVHYFGSTIRVGDQFHMWYIGRVGRHAEWANYEGYDGRLCYATSRDGIHWTKPDLGLVDYQGSTANNLVDFPRTLICPWPRSSTTLRIPIPIDGSRLPSVLSPAALASAAAAYPWRTARTGCTGRPVPTTRSAASPSSTQAL